jgi:RHS repeat-associated protein
VIASASGAPSEETDYFPYGGEIPIFGTDSNNYKFTGKERDSETGLDYFGARYYGSNMGRWILPDWSYDAVPLPYADIADPQTLTCTATFETTLLPTEI